MLKCGQCGCPDSFQQNGYYFCKECGLQGDIVTEHDDDFGVKTCISKSKKIKERKNKVNATGEII